jgi:hypothetical protein
MGQTLHHLACNANGVQVSLDGPYRTSLQVAPFHEAGIQFDLPQRIGPSAPADAVNFGVRFDEANALLHGIESRPACHQNGGRLSNANAPYLVANNDGFHSASLQR